MKKIMMPIYFSIAIISFALLSSETQRTSKIGSSSIKGLITSYAAAIKTYFARASTLEPAQTGIPLAHYYDMIFITEYLIDTNRLNLFVKNKNEENIQKLPTKQWDDVISYQLSPQKKYLFINTMVVGLLGKYAATDTIKLINVHSLKEIASFMGQCITYECSPDETSLIIARVQKGFGEQLGFIKQRKEGASDVVGEQRSQSATGEILRYELFDIASQTILKTFENVKLLTYINDAELIIKYDNGEIKKIEIQRDISLSPLQKILNFL